MEIWFLCRIWTFDFFVEDMDIWFFCGGYGHLIFCGGYGHLNFCGLCGYLISCAGYGYLFLVYDMHIWFLWIMWLFDFLCRILSCVFLCRIWTSRLNEMWVFNLLCRIWIFDFLCRIWTIDFCGGYGHLMFLQDMVIWSLAQEMDVWLLCLFNWSRIWPFDFLNSIRAFDFLFGYGPLSSCAGCGRLIIWIEFGKLYRVQDYNHFIPWTWNFHSISSVVFGPFT